ncbi:MAG: molecular chaperone HtpG [candidate division KSB1 bacterium]|nr:molecular chaperone HtpG [candidate division KSB1 bacterium]MDZ7335152.1 molecular chaperone HtpG [candidate division KSB1 bacterium]MDZ7356835.1 molecular chaperone HtpG [candidate division KSB1 bacterium]MDZ7377140.1 molecular chaperone HtpG [candidate division KSB1 bacterium]MDZ7401326.1 molecular chaperone HtpG [candidate division KSB1 bacterium]
MSDEPQSGVRTYKFKAEIKQLLDILARSLYTNREVFVRELVSNAADALDKVRFESIRGTELYQPELEFEIRIELDKDKKTFTIIDTGIGMTREELIKNIGTIAHSGSAEFLKRVAENEQAGPTLIGQFGVGFYSVYMVAENVEIITRSYLKDAEACRWSSDGTGSYTIEPIASAPRGTRVVVHLRDDAVEFADKYRIQNVIKKYSNFVPFPIKLDGEQINKISAIWREPKTAIKDEQYQEFYKFFANTNEDPLSWLHFSADAPIQLSALLFFPKTNYEIMGFSPREHGVNLFVKRILIQTDNKDLLPQYLRFVKGVVDTEDLPLNISRETLQENTTVIKIRNLLIKRILGHLSEMANNEADKYREFWNEFGRILKEGYLDYPNREKIAELFRFNSSVHSDEKELCSLDDYIGRMKEGQKEIYYISGANRETIARDPHLEIFRKKNIEVLYLYDPIDEFVFSGMGQYKEKRLVSADQADLKALEEIKAEAAPEDQTKEELKKKSRRDLEKLCTRIKNILGDRIEEARLSERLIDSPAVLVSKDTGMSSQMQKILHVIQKDTPPLKKILEINGTHPLILNLLAIFKKDPKAEYLTRAVEQLFYSVQLQDGFITDPHSVVSGMQSLLKDATEWYMKDHQISSDIQQD